MKRYSGHVDIYVAFLFCWTNQKLYSA